MAAAAAQKLPSMSCFARSLTRSAMIRPVTSGRRLINTTVTPTESDALPESLLTTPMHTKDTSNSTSSQLPLYRTSQIPTPRSHNTPSPISTTPSEPGPSSSILPPLTISQSVRENLQYLVSQPPFYITLHIYGKPYLVTAGDTVRLPFRMDGVMPGDVLRFNRATVLGSRDWTLKAGRDSSPTTVTPSTPADSETPAPIIGNTDSLTPETLGVTPVEKSKIRSNKAPTYLDERLFTCRAVVMGVESEPMRVMEKTKQRQRHTKHVKSKHKYTVLKIREVSVNEMSDAES